MPAPSPESLIDTVDDSDHVVGAIERREALKVGANFRTAHVFVFNHDNRLLLQRLAPTRQRHPHRWGSSVAAYLHRHESYEAGAKRRMHEELCLETDLVFVDKVVVQDARSLKFVGLFRTTADEVANCEPDHIAELRYWTIEEIDEALLSDPDCFTPTFLVLFARFRG